MTKVSLAKLVKTGLPVTLSCGAACALDLSLAADARTAKKLRLKSRNVGRLRGRFAKGTYRPSLKLAAAAQKALRRIRTVKLTFSGSVTQSGGTSPLKIAKLLTLKR